MPMDPLHYTGSYNWFSKFENQTNKSFSIQIQVLSKELGQIILSLKPKDFAIYILFSKQSKFHQKSCYTILCLK